MTAVALLRPTAAEMLHLFFAAVQIKQIRCAPALSAWQRNYHEHFFLNKLCLALKSHETLQRMHRNLYLLLLTEALQRFTAVVHQFTLLQHELYVAPHNTEVHPSIFSVVQVTVAACHRALLPETDDV